MKKKIKNIIGIILLAVIVLSVFVLAAGCKPKEEELPESAESTKTRVEIDFAAPDFSVELLNGETVKLSDYRGKVVLLNFWATWCGPCVGEMPDIQKLSETYPDDLAVLAVNCGEKKDKADGFIKENSYNFNVGLDENGDIQKLYPSNGIPYTIIIDAEGIITEIQLGAGEDMYSVYEGYIKSAMAK